MIEERTGLLNEQDVREEIIAPILRALGYRSDTANDIRREVSLKYPYDSLGRKKSNDPLLRGRADYLMEVDRRIRWIIEAKPPESAITGDDVMQAHSYARHGEIRAPYFCLCDGASFRVYGTDVSPEAEPLQLIIGISDSKETAEKLRSLLGPEALRTRFATLAADTLPSIGPGLSSFAQITAGRVQFNSSNPNIPFLNGFVITVTGGAIQRAPDGGLLFYFTTLAPHAAMQRLNEKLGLARFEATAAGSSLSVDESHPTTFSAGLHLRMPRGESVLSVSTWEENELLCDIDCDVTVSGTGILAGSHMVGRFDAKYHYRFELSPEPKEVDVAATGTFSLALK